MNMSRIRALERALHRGFILLEVLVAIVVLAFGLLGLAGLQAKMQAAEMESYQRSQALVLLEDMGARINANRAAAATYDTTSLSPAWVGAGDLQPANCSGVGIGVDRDLCEWSNALKGNTEQRSGNNIGATIAGRGCIEPIGGANPPSVRIVVAWQGLTGTAKPYFTCAQGQYGNETLALRRAIAEVVTIGNLAPAGP